MTGEISAPQAIPSQFLQQQQLQNHATQVQEIQNLVNRLPVGAQIVAQVTGADKNGNLTVKVAGSDLLLSSPIALAKGAALTLRIVNTSDNVAFQLISVDGKLPPTQAQTVSNQLQQNPAIFLKPAIYDEIAQKQVVGSQSQPISQPQTNTPTATTAINQQAVVVSNQTPTQVQGIVLTPAPEALRLLRSSLTTSLPADLADDAIAQLPLNLNAGSKVDFKINAVQTAQFQSSDITDSTTETNAIKPNTAQTPIEEVQTGNQVLKGQDFMRQNNEQLLRDNGAQSFQPKMSVASDATIKLTGLVVALGGGQAVVDTALGRLVIANQFDSNRVQVGSVIDLSVAKFVAEELPLQQSTIKDLFNEWPALKALNNSLAQAGLSEHMNKLAGLDSAFVSRLAGFFRAVKDNNIDNWLSSDLIRDLDPDTLDAIKAKMTGDFANLTRLYHDNANSGWNTVLFPVYDGKELQQARFYVKDLQDENTHTSSGKRFVVELNTGAFGEVQLDGLVRKNMAQNRFDLMVRTAENLPEDVRLGITEIFNNSAQITGIKGSVDFANLDSAIRPAGAVLAQQMDHSGLEV